MLIHWSGLDNKLSFIFLRSPNVGFQFEMNGTVWHSLFVVLARYCDFELDSNSNGNTMFWHYSALSTIFILINLLLCLIFRSLCNWYFISIFYKIDTITNWSPCCFFLVQDLKLCVLWSFLFTIPVPNNTLPWFRTII